MNWNKKISTWLSKFAVTPGAIIALTVCYNTANDLCRLVTRAEQHSVSITRSAYYHIYVLRENRDLFWSLASSFAAGGHHAGHWYTHTHTAWANSRQNEKSESADMSDGHYGRPSHRESGVLAVTIKVFQCNKLLITRNPVSIIKEIFKILRILLN